MNTRIDEEEDGWRCVACGYFHRGDIEYEEAPVICEDCGTSLIDEV